MGVGDHVQEGEAVTLRCSHRGGCPATFEGEYAHVAFIRAAARRAGWGQRISVHRVTGETRHRDLCPRHYAHAQLMERQKLEKERGEA